MGHSIYMLYPVSLSFTVGTVLLHLLTKTQPSVPCTSIKFYFTLF